MLKIRDGPAGRSRIAVGGRFKDRDNLPPLDMKRLDMRGADFTYGACP
jgi:hypothetical protein